MDCVSSLCFKTDVCGSVTGLVTVPTGFDPHKESLPVIVFLHGVGERGDDLNRLKAWGIPKIFSEDPDYHGQRVITLSPQCPAQMVLSHLVYPLKQWIDQAVAALNGDKDRISVTGASMGGFATWSMIMAFPDYFSCAAPICGGGMSWNCGCLRKNIKIRVYHGSDDPTVPIQYALLMVEAARKQDIDVELFVFDKVQHSSWLRAYGQTDLIDWLISQKK